MTMPNIEELIAVLEATNQFHDNADICTADVIAVLRSQAERIAELERESETHSKAYGLAIVERDNLRTEVEAVRKANLDCVDHYNAARAEVYTLRAQLDAIAATEPVAWIDEYGNAFPLAARQYSTVGKGWKPLFTRPMPAESKDAERYRWFADIAVNGYFDKAEKAFACFESAESCTKQELDAAIDAAIAKGAK